MITAAIMLTVLAGCSNAGGERARTVDDADGGVVGRVPLRTLTVEQARAALLAAADLPTGWTAEPDSGAPKIDSSGDYAECPTYEAVMTKVRGANDIAADITAPGGADLGEALLPMSEADATDLFTEFSAATTACKKLTSETDSGLPFDMYLVGLSFPQLADETFAFRTTATVLRRTINLDVTVMRRGGVLIFIVHQSDETIDSGLTEEVARRAVTKVDAALS